MKTTLELENPLLGTWNTPHGLPPFDQIKAEHFAPALNIAMAEHLDELAIIAASDREADFDNTLVLFDRSGSLVRRILAVFDNLVASVGSAEWQKLEAELTPSIAQYRNAVNLHLGVSVRVEAVWKKRRSLKLKGEDLRLLESVRQDFVRAGAYLNADKRQRLSQINQSLAVLHTQFNQMVLADEAEYLLRIDNPKEQAGLPDWLIESAYQAARDRGLAAGAAAIVLSASMVEAFLTWSSRRDLRERLWKAWVHRGETHAERDTRPIIVQIINLRQELAQIHGYANFAEYAVADRMAETPEHVADLFAKVWEPAKAQAQHEEALINRQIIDFGDQIDLEAWDWRYYAEKVRANRYDIDDLELKPYFELEAMICAMFYCAGKLYGLEFIEIRDLDLYHGDVRAWEVRYHETGHIAGIFLADNYARENKRGGAWMSELRSQTRNLAHGEAYPIVINNNNFSRPPTGKPSLLSIDDLRTLFHEFGHALHGLLSNVTYQRLAGTNVVADFVELPSQLMEQWASEDEVLRQFARHVETDEVIKQELLDRLRKARGFNQGFLTVQYMASALFDLHLHTETVDPNFDLDDFEKSLSRKLAIPELIGMRHRAAHFRHLFSDEAYAAGYYVYLWAEVLAMDAFAMFKESGRIFDLKIARRLKNLILGVGSSRRPSEAFRKFRGREADVQAMLEGRGIAK